MATIVLFIGLIFVYLAWKCFRQKKYGRLVLSVVVALFFIGGAITLVNDSSSSSSESSSSSKSEDTSSKKESSTDAKHKKQAQQGVDDINKKIAQDDQLSGLKVKLDKYDTRGEDYDVQIPDSAMGGSDSQLREICKNVFTIIRHETGNQDPTVTYYDESGNEIAKTKWDGSIKLEN